MTAVNADAPRLQVTRPGTEVVLLDLGGDWLSRDRLPGVEAVEKEFAAAPAPQSLRFATTHLGEWNSNLLIFVLRCQALCQEHQVRFEKETLPAGVQKLIHLSEAVADNKDARRMAAKIPFVQRVGEGTIAELAGAREMLAFLGESVLSVGRLLTGRAQFSWRSAFLVMQTCGPGALGIVALINLLVGMILAFVGATELAQFGASIYVANLVGVATVREMGCLMTGIIMCGRTGAAFAAQLGTMTVNEEIDALKTFGISSMDYLVLPRMLSLVIMMPLLVVFADFIAIFGGFLVAVLTLDISSTEYINRTIEGIRLGEFFLGVAKGAFFGLIVALTGCLRGLQCGSTAEAVGQATTSAVVIGITSIIAADGIFAVLCHALNW